MTCAHARGHSTPRYVVKTVSKREKNNLLRIAPAYLAHCRQHPSTLIKYLGCHSIRLPLNTCKVYFVVMANVLPKSPKMDATFDLKGATSNRQRVRGRGLTELLSGAKPPAAFKTLLDKDWMSLSDSLRHAYGLRLPPAESDALFRQLSADACFLAAQVMHAQTLTSPCARPCARADADPHAPSDACLLAGQGLMDYSILLGVQLSAAAPGGHLPTQDSFGSSLSAMGSSFGSTMSISPSAYASQKQVAASSAARTTPNGSLRTSLGHGNCQSQPSDLAGQVDDVEHGGHGEDGADGGAGSEADRGPARHQRASQFSTKSSFTSADGSVYYLGMIDILEGWRFKWRVQGAILYFFFRYVCCNAWYNPAGITAIRPDEYAMRFEEFLAVYVLKRPYTTRSRLTWNPFW